MASDPDRPYVDALSMTDDEAHLYEAVATLEHLGWPATRTEIAAAADLDDAALETALRTLTTRRALIRTGSGKDAVYEPATREWSVVPADLPAVAARSHVGDRHPRWSHVAGCASRLRAVKHGCQLGMGAGAS